MSLDLRFFEDTLYTVLQSLAVGPDLDLGLVIDVLGSLILGPVLAGRQSLPCTLQIEAANR